MKFIFAPDSFKGTLSALDICLLLQKAAKESFPDCEIISVPISDGGEGALEVVIPSLLGSYEEVFVKGPLQKEVKARYGVFQGDSVLIEMALASGLTLVPEKERDILNANTYGTGELILHALEAGYRKFYIAIGGSATNDGGIGFASALGVRFLDKDGAELEPIPRNLIKIAKIDSTKIHTALKTASFTVMCDVTNPLTGPNGATYVFGKQKGADAKTANILEAGMINYASVLEREYQITIRDRKGAGAAGGLGAGLMVFANATLQSGIETILELLKFEETIQDASLVVTGEGRIDSQSVYGKVLFGIGQACKRQNVPCVAIAGVMGEDADAIYPYGVDSIITTVNAPMELEEALERSEELFLNAARRMFRLLKIGVRLDKTVE